MDGSVLSAPYDPSQRRPPASRDHSPPTEVLIAPTVAAEKPAVPQSTIRAEAPRLPTPFAESRPISSPSATRSPSWLLRSALILRGLIAIMFGLYAMVADRYWILYLPFSLYALIAGVPGIIAGLKVMVDYKTGWLLLVEGVFTVVAGIWLYIDLPPHVLLDFIAPICLIFSGVCQTVAALQLQGRISRGWSLMLAGGASLLFGFALALVLLVLSPTIFALHHYTDPLVGVCGLVAGALFILAGIVIRGKNADA